MRELLPGMRFGRLTVDGVFRKTVDGSKKTTRYASCICDCGQKKDALGHKLFNGSIKSCGCWRREHAASLALRHGHATRSGGMSRTYKAWLSMRNRCHYEGDIGFKYYGGRGIRVCERWMNSFENFLEDMGEVGDGMSLDRVDVNGNYEPENCRWSDQKTQRENQRPYKPNLLRASVEDLIWALESKISEPLQLNPRTATAEGLVK